MLIKDIKLKLVDTNIYFIDKDIEPPYTKLKTPLNKIIKRKQYKFLNETLNITHDCGLSVGDYINLLKNSGDDTYKLFLNKNGDNKFCKFYIDSYLNDKGIYFWCVNDKIKYIGRCVDYFESRINKNYGNISPSSCFKDGQSTNCHINSLINSHSESISLYLYIMSNSEKIDIEKKEKELLKQFNFDWNVQKK